MPQSVTLLEIGEKYINREGEIKIYLGFAKGKVGSFVLDDQKLFETLKQPYSKQALVNLLNANGVDALKHLNQSTEVMTDEHGNTLWHTKAQLEQRTERLKAELKTTEKLTRSFKSTHYLIDCPNGEVYNAFIHQFQKVCSDEGLGTKGFSFHGRENENTLTVCHNGRETGDDDFNQWDVFAKLQSAPEFTRLQLTYCQATNVPKVC